MCVCVCVCVCHSSSLKLCGLRKEQLVSKNKQQQSLSTRIAQRDQRVCPVKSCLRHENMFENVSQSERVNVEGCFYSVSCRACQR